MTSFLLLRVAWRRPTSRRIRPLGRRWVARELRHLGQRPAQVAADGQTLRSLWGRRGRGWSNQNFPSIFPDFLLRKTLVKRGENPVPPGKKSVKNTWFPPSIFSFETAFYPIPTNVFIYHHARPPSQGCPRQACQVSPYPARPQLARPHQACPHPTRPHPALSSPLRPAPPHATEIFPQYRIFPEGTGFFPCGTGFFPCSTGFSPCYTGFFPRAWTGFSPVPEIIYCVDATCRDAHNDVP